jgi:NAD-dependent SIR2 family protein deacetylase
MNKERIDLEGCHGLLGKENWKKPYCVAKSDEPNRKDQGNMTTASEYLDEDDVLEEKMEMIANLIKKSKCVIAYTGAGLSRAAGIGDYASKAKNSIMNEVPKLKSAFDAKPTYAHLVLSKLEEKGLLHYYVQQNHDGLPQKAGFPQEKINEIHGAWYDPSNQVVQFSESLRSDLFEEMTEMEKKIDLCICLGTSLSGMNADRMAWTPAKRFKKSKGNGTIMINLQKTAIDDSCSVRVWSKIDDAFKILVEKLSIDMNKPRTPPKFNKDVFYIPYNQKGEFLGKKPKKLMKLDFSTGSKIQIIHPDSSTFGVIGTVKYKHDDHYSVQMKARKSEKESLYALGTWMIDLALRGAVKQFSYANVNPEFIDCEKIEAMDLEELKTVQEKEIPTKLQIGNTHELKDKESHHWTMYVKSNKDNIEKVTFQLHPTFKPSEVEVKSSPFQISRIGWGTFTVEMEIYLKNGEKFTMKHALSFEGSGSEKIYEI